MVVKTLQARNFEVNLADITWIENVVAKLAAGCAECDSHTFIGLMHYRIDNIVQRLTPELVKR